MTKRKRLWKETIYCHFCTKSNNMAVKFIQRFERVRWDKFGQPSEEVIFDPHPIRPVCRKCFEGTRNLRRRNIPDATYETVVSYADYIIQEIIET